MKASQGFGEQGNLIIDFREARDTFSDKFEEQEISPL